jgi:hypothetical protein
LNAAKGAVASVSQSLGDLPSSFKTETGDIDGERLLDAVRNNKDAKLWLDTYENLVREDNEKVEQARFDVTS